MTRSLDEPLSCVSSRPWRQAHSPACMRSVTPIARKVLVNPRTPEAAPGAGPPGFSGAQMGMTGFTVWR